ncbi:MAG TPA: MgtC/SapB family protein [Caulobacteraceae bacterium]|nr:MgtC/SapB family protein [Caulobacteraceae bacterium]
MSAYLTPADLALRVGLTVAAGAAMGLNRQEHGRPAGMRTTVLVALAACVAMLQADLLLPLSGKTQGSFAVMDLMRLPLGILSGIGFIGAGVILKRGDMVLGVTTAATLWVTTVIGLCFGGGQVTLGLVATAISLFVLWPGSELEERLAVRRRGEVVLEVTGETPSAQSLSEMLEQFQGRARLVRRDQEPSGRITARYALLWRARPTAEQGLQLLQALESRFRVISIEFNGP